MERRRGVSKRPASSEEVECWTQTAVSLSTLNNNLSINNILPETVGRVNRLISAWPPDELPPAEGIDGVKNVHKKLVAGLAEIRLSSERDVKAIDEAIERLSILIGLRKAPESAPPEMLKRAKRPRAHSPTRALTPSTPRGSVGPQASGAFSREPKARREALSGQLPLQEGRLVAFHPNSSMSKVNGAEAAETDDNTWILAKVLRSINQDKNRYEVEDAEPDKFPAPKYKTTLRAILPLPDPDAPANSPTHPSAYPQFPTGTTVLGLYPETSCFYRAQVIATPRDIRNPANSKMGAMYQLKFEDDEDQLHLVAAHMVVEWPGPIPPR
ncbi:SGF29 tudor-like domain-containing protein [Amylostereum chailletii]|nr:SGF29 tudor-like domain-containing protein [Amylostereum chailletii]